MFKQLALAVCVLFLAGSLKAAPSSKVFISQIVEHPALDSTAHGIQDSLKAAGFNNLDIRLESAQANSALAAQIASKFISQNPTVVVGIGTGSAQSFMPYVNKQKIALIFSSVTDPQSAGLDKVAGVSNFIPLEPQLALFKKLQPNLKRLGILYNPGESNAVSIVQKLARLCPTLGLTLIQQSVNKTADVAQAATKLAAQVDAILISNDNTALSALPSVIQAANKAKIPVYVSDTDAVAKGALAALGPDQYQVGVQTGLMITKVLNGTPITDIGIEFPENTELYLNPKTAQQLNINIPSDLKFKTPKGAL